jgi:signal transduction histidine kinase
MVQGILSQFQGRLSLENDLSGGARVRLILPLTQGDEKGLDSAQPA